MVERINSSLPLRKDLIVEVLTVGSLYPPQVIMLFLSIHLKLLTKIFTLVRILNDILSSNITSDALSICNIKNQ